MKPLQLEPCRPVEVDGELVMRWRNDPLTLSMFYHREPKVWESFWPEFRDTYFADPVLPPAFAIAEGRAVAFLRFERVEIDDAPAPTSDISINVDPAARGKGYGLRALLGALEYLRKRGFASCWAEIRVENVASQRAFARAGFELVDEIAKFIEDTAEVCRIKRFVAML